jgi:hypothetical protein
MNRSRISAVPFALAACVSLNGCTIYTYDYQSRPPHPHHPQQQPPAPQATQPAPVVTAPAAPTGTSPIGKPNLALTRPRPHGSNGSTTTGGPLVTSTTVFGGPTVAAFHGYMYVIPEGTTKMPNFDDLVPFGQLYTDRFAVAPTAFTSGFPGALQQEDWFAIRYRGKFLVPAAAKWVFKLVSDDGAILYVDGKKVIDNDGVHTAKSALGEIDLTAGTHQLELDYFQEKKGSVALQLWTVVGGRDVEVIGVQ